MSIAVVLSSYNGEKYIEEQLKSILNQTKKPNKVYILDDCSTDNTVKIVEKVISDNNLKNWCLSINSTNQGWKRNFFELLDLVEEDYIFLADQDDIWDIRKIEKMYNIIHTRENMELLASGYEAIYEDDTRHITKKITKTIQNTQKVYQIPFNEKFMHVLRPGCTYVLKKSFFNDIKKYWNINIPHDAMIWRISTIRGTGYVLDDKLIKWRRYNSSTSNPNRKSSLYKNRYKMKYDFLISNHKENLIFLEILNKYIKNVKIPKATIDLILEIQKFENLYYEALNQKSIKKLIIYGLRYKKFFLSSKTIFANVMRTVMSYEK